MPEPPRKPFTSVIEENAARGPHTPIPAAAPTRPPPAMPMAPPRGLEGPRVRLDGKPGQTLVGLGSPSGKRPPMANLPPAESIPPRPPARSASDEVHAKYGKGSFSGPAWAFLVAALLAAAVAITYFVTRNLDSSRPPKDEVLTKVNALAEHQATSDEKRDAFEKAMTERQGNTELELKLQRQSIETIRDLMNMRNPLPPSPVDSRAAPMNEALKK